MFIMYTSSAVVFWQFHVFTFHPYLKNGNCAAHTECLSCVNPPGSIFQLANAETFSFHTDLTCRNRVQTGDGSWSAIPALYGEG